MRAFIAGLAVAAGASMALADSVTLDYRGQDGRVVKVDRPVGSDVTVSAGYMRFHVDDGSSSGGKFTTGEFVRTFCIDISSFLIDPDDYEIKALTDVSPAVTAAEADALAKMYAYALSNSLDLTDDDTGSTFQLAVWEVLSDYDGTLASLDTSDGSGTFSVKSTSGFLGDGPLLTSLFGAAHAGTLNPNIIVRGLDSDGGQDQMYFVVVPLPGSASLAAVGLLGLGVVARRRRGR